ncbi:MAG: LptF/LptG family permease [Mariprofundaceae bacterium]|nr:LptF/LptG family permease [Mariprofundaceae bacterium]
MVLDRYIIKLWLPPFLGMLSIVMGVELLARALKLLELFADKDIDWGFMLTLLEAVLPEFLMVTVPMAFFFAMQSMIIKLYESSEMDAFRASGLSYLRIFRSLFVLSIITWLCLTFVSMVLLPKGQKIFQGLLAAIQTMKPAPDFEPFRFTQGIDDFNIYVKGKDKEGLFQSFLLEDRRTNTPIIYMAEKAKLEKLGQQLQFTLFHGTRLEGQGEELRSLAFKRYQVSINMGDLGMLKVPNMQDWQFTTAGLWKLVRETDRTDALAEWNRRLLVPTTVFILMIFAIPLSYTPKRSGKTGAYLVGIGLVLCIYNLQVTLNQKVANGSYPWWSMWVGQGGLLILATWLFYQAGRGNYYAISSLFSPLKRLWKSKKPAQ